MHWKEGSKILLELLETLEIKSLLVKILHENNLDAGYMLASENVAIILAFSLIQRYNCNNGYA